MKDFISTVVFYWHWESCNSNVAASYHLISGTVTSFIQTEVGGRECEADRIARVNGALIKLVRMGEESPDTACRV